MLLIELPSLSTIGLHVRRLNVRPCRSTTGGPDPSESYASLVARCVAVGIVPSNYRFLYATM